MKKFLLPLSWWVSVLVFCILLAVYAFTLAPAVLHIDSGELAAAQYSLGVTHPTGYPIFSFLGYLFLQIPIFDRPIVQSNFLAALWTAAGVALVARFFFRFLSYHFPASKSKKAIEPIRQSSEMESFWISIAAGLFLGLTTTVWAQATSVEVYSLQILLFSIILNAMFYAWKENTQKAWAFVAVAFGFGFSNHMTTLMVLPGFAVLYLYKNGLSQKSIKNLILPALAGFSVLLLSYGFLFMRAESNALINWGNIHDYTTLKRHLTGHQYRTWIFAGSKVAARNLGEFLKALPSEWAMIGPVFMILGIGYALKISRIWAWTFLVALIFNIGYVIQYDIKDLEPYFMLAMIAMAFFIAIGLKRVLDKWQKPNLAPALLAIPALALALNLTASDQSETRFFETYTEKSLGSIEPNALVLTQQWDFLITPYYYFRVVEGKYKNLMVLDKELMRRSWYLNRQMQLLDPEILKGAEAEKEEFIKQLQPFEESRPYDAGQIENAYQSLIGKILSEQSKKRPIYIGMEYFQSQELKIPNGFALVPMGFWLKMVPTGQSYVESKPIDFKPFYPKNWSSKSVNAYYSEFITNTWNTGCRARIEYETRNGKPDAAKLWEQKMIF